MPGKVRSDGFPRPKPDRTEVPGIFCRTVYAMHSILSAMILLQIISVLIVVSALIAALIIGLDLTRRRQPMRIMNPVWILTGLWAGAAALWAYFSFGRSGPGNLRRPVRTEAGSLPHPAADRLRPEAQRDRTECRADRRVSERERTAYPDDTSRTEHLGRPLRNGLRQRTGRTTAPNGPCQPYRSSTHAPYRTANKRAIIPSAMPRCRKRSGPRTRVRWRTRSCQAWPA